MNENWTNKRVTVMGLGRFEGGVSVARWLAKSGARVTITDKLPAEKLAASIEQLRGVDVQLHLGAHDQRNFTGADLVVVNPAVREDSPFLAAARSAGVPLTTEINLFLERCPARCVGVTGSVGKSTVTAMIAHALQSEPERQGGASAHSVKGPEGPRGQVPLPRIWLGGNIGHSLLDDLPAMLSADIVVLELSSFQLQRTPAIRWSPHIAVITNITPNHLDWHGTFEAYRDAKLNLLRFQDPQRDAVVIGEGPELRREVEEVTPSRGNLWGYGLEGRDPIAAKTSTTAQPPLRWPELQLSVPGRHNRLNAAAALTVAHLLGTGSRSAVAALGSFAALPDRLQRVAVQQGVTYYNDSKSTTPEAASTALGAIETPVLLILGGYDKHSDMRALAALAARRARFVACIGQTGHTIADLVKSAGGNAEYCGDLPAAIAACRQRSQSGDTVLLSPACASWDQFPDYRARGEMFTRLVQT